MYLSGRLSAQLGLLLQLLLTAMPAMAAEAVVAEVEVGDVAWPNGPLVASGRWILNAAGENVTYAGANWPGAAETMLPEGLQYQSIATIVGKIKSLGMNAVRLTYAIQMVDEVYDNGGTDIGIGVALTQALGAANGTRVLGQILAHNPTFTAATTRLEVFDAVAAECHRQHIYVHLDNHISKAEWCCSTTDGNAWWGDRYFDTDRWLRGIAFMAKRGHERWPSLVSVALRNEPREPADSTAARATYNWRDWYGFVQRGAAAVHAANPDVLIFLSGMSYDTYLGPVTTGGALTPGTAHFALADFGDWGARKIVLELHNYQTGATSCTDLTHTLDGNGFSVMAAGAARPMPVLMTEFGFLQDASTYRGVYATCLASYLPSMHAGWTIWVLAGSYYIRSGRQDYDETWGLLNHDWSAWRSPQYIENQLRPMVKASLG